MQSKTPTRVGYGQGQPVILTTTAPAVRIRHGNTVQRGEYVHNLAFVWHDEETAAPTRQIIVRADRQGSWLWEGQRSIDLPTAFPGNREAARLLRPFEDWQRYFSKTWNGKQPQRFYWGRYHQEGLQLARRLQAAVIDQAVVRYQRPADDPQSRWAEEIVL